MEIRLIAQGLVLYTIVAGAITVGCVYLLTHSGLYTLVAAGIGLFLVVLGGTAGATGGPVSASVVGEAESAGMSGLTENMQLSPSLGDAGSHAILVFYGLGLFLWSVIVLTVFRSGLQ